MKHIPNILTIFRIVLIPFIVLSIVKEEFLLAIILFTVSSISDILDGVIARRFDLVSNFGKLMDPVADKLTQISIVCTLGLKNIIPIWIFGALILKEFIMMLGGLYLYKRKDFVVYSKWYGKCTTVLIYIAVISSFLIEVMPTLGKKFLLFGYCVSFDVIIFVVALIFALFSLLSYIQEFGVNVLKKMKK
jgi:cardiolipin synthase